MRTRKLGLTGIDVSSIALGTAMFGFPKIGCDERAAREIFNAYRESGGNFIDTADFYGQGASEQITGRLLGGCRSQFILATKVGQAMGPGRDERGLSRAHILRAVDASLERLRTDYIDLYQIHAVDPWNPLEETLDALGYLVRSGRVRQVGCSNIEAWRLAKVLTVCRSLGQTAPCAAQLRYSLLSREIEREHIPLCESEGLAIIVFSSLAAGVLTGKVDQQGPPPDSRLAKAQQRYAAWLAPPARAVADLVVEIAKRVNATPAQVALAWTMGRPGITSVICGASRGEQMQQNLIADQLQLPPDECARLDAVSAQPLGYPYDFMIDIERDSLRPPGVEQWPWSAAWHREPL
jgi:aryl-alcohol dehydrogenase-like predicted oxidoreductase